DRPGRAAGRGATRQGVSRGPPARGDQPSAAATRNRGAQRPGRLSPGDRLLLGHGLRPVPTGRGAARDLLDTDQLDVSSSTMTSTTVASTITPSSAATVTTTVPPTTATTSSTTQVPRS